MKNGRGQTELLRLLLILSIPLAFNPWGWSAFELPKAVLLRTFVLLLGWRTVVAWLNGPWSVVRLRPRSGVSRAVLLFALAALASTIFSPDPQTSVWGTLGRQQGLLTTLAYVGIYLITAHELRTHQQVRRLWGVLVWGSVPVVLYGLMQAAGCRPLGWESDGASPVLSTLGRSNFLGSYLVLIVPLTAARAFAARRPFPTVVLLTAQLICAALTLARGAWMGLSAALLIGLLARCHALGRRRAGLTVLAGLILTTGLVLLLLLRPPGIALAHIPGFDRLVALTHTDQGSVAARLTIWRATLRLIMARPWLGYGLDTMWTRFMRVFPPELVYYQGRGVVVDRAHNVWLDLGMRMGLVGAVVFAALLVAAFVEVKDALRSTGDPEERWLWVALAAALGGHVLDLHVSFALTTTSTVFWVLLAAVTALGRGLDGGEAGRDRQVLAAPRLVYLPPTLVIVALLGQISVRPLAADIANWRSRRGTSSRETRVETAERAVALWPIEPEYRLRLAELYATGGECTAAEAQMMALKRHRPDDPTVCAAYGTLYAGCGAPSRAEAAWREAIRLAPNIAAYHVRLGLVLAENGRLDEAADALERVVALDATDGTAYRRLAEVYQVVGREVAAEEARQQAEYWTKKTMQ
ncbi:MAG: O-antigen ligase family protein [Anaerolineae bacterium]